MSTADVVAREAAWLQTSGDSLPALPASAGGLWQVVQGYWPRTPEMNKTGLYVLRPVIADNRASSQRIRTHYTVTLRCVWPVLVSTTAGGVLEAAQQDLDSAVDVVIQRIRGPLGDKSHGGRFLSAGENPRKVDAQFADPVQSMAQLKSLRAHIVYEIDDYETSG